MQISQEKSVTIFSQHNMSFDSFLIQLKSNYEQYKTSHLIIDLTPTSNKSKLEYHSLIDIVKLHQSNAKSVVLVGPHLTYDLFPDSINISPTVGEAHDIISLEEMERDLGF